MRAIAHLSIGLLLLVTGAVLALGFADAEFLWFTGRPLGIVLVLLGAFDVYQGLRARAEDGPQNDS
ncbi:hypothetical protein [Aeromicrobium sp. CTD01-1L150]|uniref:hypothetical protein n=1 Tax=Aeromicrobium sp. CTD01-1L150 TaxID=3341830 RepID=UPI0035C18162